MMIALFFIVAILYSLVGFGGGSSYIAIMVLFAVPYTILPQIALLCNLVVVTGGSYHYIRRQHFDWNLFWPFIIASVPMAFIGGRIPISKEVYLGLLGAVLIFSGARLLLTNFKESDGGTQEVSVLYKILAGGVIGFISGLVGIGGGIFLSPLLLNLRWAKPKTVASIASMFILVNSLGGLGGQVLKNNELSLASLFSYGPLFLAVFLGGQIGSRLGAGKLSSSWVRAATACLVLFVGGRLVLGF